MILLNFYFSSLFFLLMIQYNIHESKNSESIKNISWTFIVDEILRRSFFSSFINKCNVHDFVKFLLFLLMIQYTYTILIGEIKNSK